MGSGKIDIHEINLIDAIDSSNLVVNIGSPILAKSPNFLSSAIDISLCTLNLATYFTWSIVDDTLGFDHFAIQITYDTYDSFVENLDIALKLVILENKQKHNNKKFYKSWWSPECKNCIIERKEAILIYKNNPTTENFVKYKRAVDKSKKQIIIYKQNSWKQFCSKLNKNSNLNDTWKEACKLNNLKNTNPHYKKENGVHYS